MKRVHLLISGRVQGVMFRAFVQHHAQNIGVVGWVRNRFSGDVEVVVEGPRGDLESLLTFCREGPPYACVDDVKVEWQSATGEFKDFRTTYDA